MQNTIITQAVEWLLDKLKVKNGSWYAIVMAILALVYFGLGYITTHPELGIAIPSGLHDAANTALIILAALVGSHTTAQAPKTDTSNKDVTNTSTNKN